jgi:hypothetical protein
MEASEKVSEELPWVHAHGACFVTT